MKQVRYANTVDFCLIISIYSGCSASVDASKIAGALNKTNPPNTPANPSGPIASDGKIDLNGRWVGYGTMNPHNLWSVNFDWKDKPPVTTDTRCKVELQIIQRPDYLRFVSADITFPDVPELGYFDAKLMDSSKNYQGVVTQFDHAEFKLAETKTGSDEFSMTQIKRDGTVATSPLYDALLSFAQKKLTVSSPGPYIGAYEKDTGEAYTSSRDFTMSWTDGGALTLDEVQFWDYGSSVGHAADAQCNHVTLTHETGTIVDSDPPPAPGRPVIPPAPPAPVGPKPEPKPTVAVKTIECSTQIATFKYVIPQSLFDQALQVPAGSDQVAQEKDLAITTYFYAEANEHDLEDKPDGFGQVELADVSPLTVKVWHWNRTDGKAFRISVSQTSKVEFEFYTDSKIQSFWSDSRFTVGKVFDYAGDQGITCSVF